MMNAGKAEMMHGNDYDFPGMAEIQIFILPTHTYMKLYKE